MIRDPGMGASLSRMMRDARKARGVGVRELARRLQIDAGYLCDVEKGRKRPNPVFVQNYAAELDVPASVARAWQLAGARADGWLV